MAPTREQELAARNARNIARWRERYWRVHPECDCPQCRPPDPRRGSYLEWLGSDLAAKRLLALEWLAKRAREQRDALNEYLRAGGTLGIGDAPGSARVIHEPRCAVCNDTEHYCRVCGGRCTL